jgi:hypothetical protein
VLTRNVFSRTSLTLVWIRTSSPYRNEARDYVGTIRSAKGSARVPDGLEQRLGAQVDHSKKLGREHDPGG